MLSLEGEKCSLRALEPEDLDFLYELENNPAIWEISGTTKPYARHVLKKYLDHAHLDIFEAKQLRLCICNSEKKVIGFIDIFDFDPKNRRAGLGIIILAPEERNKGVGAEVIELVCSYAFSILNLRQLYANVMEDNAASLGLFDKLGFSRAGVKKDWILSAGSFKNEVIFQKINS